VRRREFITLMGGAAAAWPLAAGAQQGAKIPRVGIVSPGRSDGSDASRATLDSLLTGLRQLGYVEGQNSPLSAALENRMPIDCGKSLPNW